jgi:hypothetical protein
MNHLMKYLPRSSDRKNLQTFNHHSPRTLAISIEDCRNSNGGHRLGESRGMRRYWRCLLTSLGLCIVVVPYTAAATDQNAQIEALEKKIDALVDVIGQQQMTIDTLLQQRGAGSTTSQSNTENTESGASSSLADNQLVSGMQLSVCPLSLDNDRRLPDACQGMAPASVQVRPEARLGFDAALKNGTLGPFTKIKEGGVIGARWTGVLAVGKNGGHDFQLALAYSGKEYAGKVACRAVLRLAGQDVVRGFAEFVSDQNNPIVVEQGNQSLEPGLYDMEVFLSCFTAFDRLRTVVSNPDMTRYLQGVSMTLSFAEPRDKALKPIPADRIGVQK